MNIADAFNPEATPTLKRLGNDWLELCQNQPFNLKAPMPAIWHLAVTLQSNNPSASYTRMQTALRQWCCRINSDALGNKWSKKHDHQWRWFANFEGQTGNPHNSPHWHLVMTTGHAISEAKAAELLKGESRPRMINIGSKTITLRRKLPVVRHSFAKHWRAVMPGGEIDAFFLDHSEDEYCWTKYQMKHVTGSRSSSRRAMAEAQENVLVWTMFQNTLNPA